VGPAAPDHQPGLPQPQTPVGQGAHLHRLRRRTLRQAGLRAQVDRAIWGVL